MLKTIDYAIGELTEKGLGMLGITDQGTNLSESDCNKANAVGTVAIAITTAINFGFFYLIGRLISKVVK